MSGTSPANVPPLLKVLTKNGDVVKHADAEDKVARRYPFAACEVLGCEADAIFPALLLIET